MWMSYKWISAKILEYILKLNVLLLHLTNYNLDNTNLVNMETFATCCVVFCILTWTSNWKQIYKCPLASPKNQHYSSPISLSLMQNFKIKYTKLFPRNRIKMVFKWPLIVFAHSICNIWFKSTQWFDELFYYNLL